MMCPHNNSITGPSRKGKAWTPAEEKYLYDKFISACSYSEMAESLGRTESAITGRLQRMGLIKYDSEKKIYVKCKLK